MNKNKIYPAMMAALSLQLFSCGPVPTFEQEQAQNQTTQNEITEQELNAPVPGIPEDPYEPDEMMSDQKVYPIPAYSSSWGLSRRVYNKAAAYYRANAARAGNSRYLTVIDFSLNASQKRFFLFDLAANKIERHKTSHGVNSDQDNDGYATSFSNVSGSRKSSLGLYMTLGTYVGGNGYSMRLKGLSSTNSNALSRAIVVHPASYVRNSGSAKAGRSWGCPALDPSVSRSVINRIRNGSLLVIER